jgi:hypothetical protein
VVKPLTRCVYPLVGTFIALWGWGEEGSCHGTE